jgi:DNA-binding NarL/FixJ family response regulator
MSLYVIDDHPLMRDAIAMVLRRIKPEMRVVELERLAPLASAVEAYGEPKLICLDLKLPDVQGVEGVRRVRERFPSTPLAVISASPSEEVEDATIQAGADLFIEKNAGASEMTVALKGLLGVDESTSDFDAIVTEAPLKLSKRQKQLLVMMEQGLSNRDIAEKLDISEHTVKVHLWRLFKRLGVKSRTQAVHHAKSGGWTIQ